MKPNWKSEAVDYLKKPVVPPAVWRQSSVQLAAGRHPSASAVGRRGAPVVAAGGQPRPRQRR